MKSFIVAVCFFAVSSAAVICRADAPVCTGDRHYDGVACCPAVSDTTTTTLPTDPRVDCPDPAPCPTVECQCGEGTTVNNVTVNRCPTVVFPYYMRCRKDAKGHEHCPIKDHPHRFFKPMGR
jgi:hypothetical protein